MSLQVAITGASGLIGQALSARLKSLGHTPLALVRKRNKSGIYWSPDSGDIDAPALEGLDAVVHLAGESIIAGRWSKEFKRVVLESRTKGTALIARTLAKAQKPPRVLISASAVGYYGDGKDAVLDESSPPGTGFLSEICTQWEAAAEPARQARIRVVHPRIGIVLDKVGGALPQMMLPLRMGISPQIGDGAQWQSWISLHDTVEALLFAIDNEALRGPANFVAEHPLKQKDFIKEIAKAMHRPALGAIPRSFAKLIFGGEKAEQVFISGQRVRPKALLDAGFRFRDTTLAPFLGALKI